MRVCKTYKYWLIAVVGGVCLVAAAAGMAQRQPAKAVPRAPDARGLSSVFRQVARDALPSIVSIETRGKAVRATPGFGMPFDEHGPFGELFKNDPRFRDFFKNRPEGEFRFPRGLGSGFVIDSSGIIMTNSHVVSGAEKVTVRLHDGREFVATDVTTDPRSDVAVIRIDAPKDLRAIPSGDSDATQIGDWVLAVGSPFGLELSVTAGIISAKGRGPGINERENYLQTDAAINPGNSGGPLLNLNGEVIGINTAITSRSGGYDGIGFAIPIKMAHWVSRQLIEKGEVKRAYLGVKIQPLDNGLAKQFKMPVGQGALVAEVFPNTPAADVKLQPGDVVLELDGKKVAGPRSLQGIVEKLTTGKKYKLTILRDGKRTTLSIVFREMPKNFSLNRLDHYKTEKPAPSEETYNNLGIEIQELTPQIAEQLGVKEQVHGVLCSSVKSGSPAHLAGLRSGTIIEKVGTKRVTSPKEFQDAMKDVSLKKGVLLLVRTGAGGPQFVVIQADQ